MIKRIKKPNLETFSALMAGAGYQNGTTKAQYKPASGYFLVEKEGISRLYPSARDAWRAI